MFRKRDAGFVTAIVLATTTAAETADTNASGEIEELIVTAHPLSGEGLSQASTLLVGDELERKRAESIGATLALEPGIHNAQFGTAVGRPVVHGLGGPRVKVMEDRIDAMDVSVTSADHAVSVDPFIANRVEVLKGSSTLLYGSGAIGGVVDVHTGRIPHVVPEKLTGGIAAGYDDNHGGTSTVLKLDGGAGNFAWHFDATSRDGDDYEIPGFTESAALRAREEAEEEHFDEDPDHDDDHDDDHEEAEEVFGVLPGSHFDNESYAFGASITDGWGLIGFSISRTEGEYGLPGGHSHGDEDEHGDEGTPTLDLEQRRIDFEAALKDPFVGASSLNIRIGVNDYGHREIEPNGEIATLFDNRAWEGRAEIVHGDDGNRSVAGFQYSNRDFSATGEEAFIAPVETSEAGLFWVGERAFENFELEFGARLGHVEHDSSTGLSSDFTPYALSIGSVAPLSATTTLSLLFDHSSRAPIAEELYSNGPHLVTQTFEVGDTALGTETATNVSATITVQQEGWQFTATAYATAFGDYIYSTQSVAEEDELPVFQYQQDNAFFVGVDADFEARIASTSTGEWFATAMMDWVDAELDRNGNDAVSRLPPTRFGVGIEGSWNAFRFNVDVIRALEQTEIAQYELSSGAYADVRASINWSQDFADGSTLNTFVRGTNLTDDDQRIHTSYIKDLVPAPGRAVSVGLRWEF